MQLSLLIPEDITEDINMALGPGPVRSRNRPKKTQFPFVILPADATV